MGRNARLQALLHFLPMVVAYIGYGIKRATEDLLRFNREGAEPVSVRGIVRDIASHDQFVFRIDCRLDVIPHRRATAIATLHRAAVRVSQRALVLATALQLRLQDLVAQPPLSQRRDLGLQIGCACPARRAWLVLIVRSLQLLEIALDLLIDLGKHLLKFRFGEVTPLRVDGSKLTAIDRHQLTAEQIELFAQQRKGATDFA